MKLLVVDGNSIINRAFYGIRPLTTKDGMFTNAIYGFLTMLEKIKADTTPDRVAIALDLKAKTFRHNAYALYKANRKGMPEELHMQLQPLKDLLALLGYKIVTCEGYEADDILGTLAKVCEENGNECVIATGDRDSLQLVSDKVSVRLAKNLNGTMIYTPDTVLEEYGVTPKELIEIKAIQGDTNGGLFKNYGTVKTLAFFHIPLVEMLEGWTEFQNNNFKDTKDFKYINGIIGETGKRIFPGVGEDGLFEAMLEMGSTKGMFCGHDHYNNVMFSYKDIIFSYGNSVDYLAYIGISGEGSQRGCTVITTKPDATFNIEKFNYYSDRYDSEQFPREEVVMQFEDVTYQVAEE